MCQVIFWGLRPLKSLGLITRSEYNEEEHNKVLSPNIVPHVCSKKAKLERSQMYFFRERDAQYLPSEGKRGVGIRF